MPHVRTISRLLAPLLAFALLLGLALQPGERPALAARVENGAGFSFSPTGSAGPALTYPSTITVAGLARSISKVTVTLTGFSHNFPDAVDLLLVAPNGDQALLMADAGGGPYATPGVYDLTFDDEAVKGDGTPSLLGDTQLATGSYRPTNHTGLDSFPAAADPALSPPDFTGNTSLSIFKLDDPNGLWRLYAVEDTTGSTGSIAGWSLSIATADLEVEVSDTASVNAGSLLTYGVTAHNNGTEPVAGAEVTINAPANTTFSQVTPAPGSGWTCPAPQAGAVTCTTDEATPFASGTSTLFTVQVLVDKALAQGSTLTREAAISSGVAEALTANNSDWNTTSVTTLADLQVVSVDSLATVDAGATLTMTVQVANGGPSNAINATVRLPIPASTTFFSVAGPDGWTCAPSGADAVCSAPSFTGGASASFTLAVKADPSLAPGATITSQASVSSDTPDTPNTNNSGSDTTGVATVADLAVSLEGVPDAIGSAAFLEYTIVVANAGPSNATAAVLTSAVSLGTVFERLEVPEGWSCPVQPAKGDIGPISCTNPSFGVGSVTFTLVVQVLSGTPQDTVLPLSAGLNSAVTFDPDGTNNLAEQTTSVTVSADMVVGVEGVGPAVKVGSELAYAIRVTNSGPELAEGVSLSTAVPANTTFVSLALPAGWSCTSLAPGATGSLTCAKAAMGVGTETLTLRVRLGQVPNGTAIGLTAAVAVEAPSDTRAANNSFTLTTTVADAADVSVSVAGPTTGRPGATLSYSLRVGNAGPESAGNLQVLSATPDNTTFVSLAAPEGWTCTTPAAGASGAITCTNPSMGLQTDTLTLVLQIGAVSENLSFTLSAAVSSSSQDLAAANNSDDLTTNIIYRLRYYLPFVRR